MTLPGAWSISRRPSYFFEQALHNRCAYGAPRSMNKSELIQALSEKSGIASDRARYFVETMIDLMKQQLMNGGRIEIRGFDSFEMHEYDGYKGRNPHTGESVDIKPKRTPFFKPGQELKDMVNGK